MEWKINYNEAKKTVIAVIEGFITVEEDIQMGIEAVNEARKNNCTKFFIDYTNSHIGDDIYDIFEVMTNLDKLGLNKTDRLAFVIKHDIDKFYLAETFAYNRGWEKLKYFQNAEDAWQWLEAAK